MSHKTALVTGAAGFLGSHLTDALLASDHHVIGVDNLCTGNLANLAHLNSEPRFSLVNTHLVSIFNTYGPRLQTTTGPGDLEPDDAGLAR